MRIDVSIQSVGNQHSKVTGFGMNILLAEQRERGLCHGHFVGKAGRFQKALFQQFLLGIDACLNEGIAWNVIIDREGKIIFLTRLFDREEFDEMKKVIFSELSSR